MRFLFEKLDDFLNYTIIGGYDKIGYYVRRPLWNSSEVEQSMKGKICIVTGANSGLGKATSFHLAKLGATLYMLCRNKKLGEEAREEIIQKTGNHSVFLKIVDMSSQQQIRDIVNELEKELEQVDVLVNNAGVLLSERQESEDGFEMTFAINTLGYFLLANLLLPLLKKSQQGRIINVSSGGMYGGKIHLDDLEFKQRPYDGVQAYAETKRAEVILTEIWAQKLSDTNILVSSMHPGWADTKGVKTSLPRFRKITQLILRNSEQGADTIIWLAVNPNFTKEDSGKFWFDRKVRPTHRMKKTHTTPEENQQLWEICCKLTNYQES